MNSEDKKQDQFINELFQLRQEIKELKKSEIKQKKTIEALKRSEEFFRAITQHATDIIIIVQRTGKISYVNSSIESLMGYKPEELIGKSGFDYIAKKDLPRAIYEFGRAILTKHVLIQNSFGVKHKDGSIRILEGVGNNLFGNPSVKGFVMNVRDVSKRKEAEEELISYRKHLEDLVEERTSELANINTQLLIQLSERKRAEEALQKSEERFRTLIQKSFDVISINDNQGLFIYNSPSSELIFGYSPEYLFGKCLFEFIHPDDRELARAIYDEIINSKNQETSTEFRFLKEDGSWRHLETLLCNLIDYQGINGVVITSRDITERKKAEEEKQTLEERLNRAEKMEALGTLAGGVAHDLNNVLGVIVGYTELLLMDEDNSKAIKPKLENIMKGGQQAAAIVDDLLTLARRGVSGRQVIHLNNIITDSLSSPEFERLHSYHPAVKIKIDLEPQLLNISGSPVHVSKTLLNLAINASEAMPKGGILTIKTANRYVDRPIQGYDEVREGDYVVLSISDTGEGIPAVDLKRIFEPFYTKKVMGRSGTGLGLAVVWGTVKDHQGYINVESEEGKGSSFTLYFPVTRKDIPSEAVSLATSEYIGHGESILVVDDIKEQRDLAAGMLGTLNYNVAIVSSGEEAIAYLKERNVDLLVLDMIMEPGMDGLDTYMHALEIRPNQKAIIVSGFSESDRVYKAQSLGAGAYVKKPYVIEKLGMAVRTELGPNVDKVSFTPYPLWTSTED